MAMECPRCRVGLETFKRDTPDARVALDRCPQCDGVWVDGAELGDVSPHLPRIRREEHGRSVIACPRCASRTVECLFFGLVLDHCTECHGVWFDGNERIGILEARERPIAEATYRDAAVVVTEQMAHCRTCRAKVPLAKTYMTSDGVSCARCYEDALPEGDGQEALPEPSTFIEGFATLAGALAEATDPCYDHYRRHHRR